MWGALVALASAWWSWRQRKYEAETQLAIKEIDSGIRGADHMLRRLSFFAAISPLALALYDPTLANSFFNRLDVLPGWYVELLMLMFISIWGLSVAKEVLPGLVGRIIKAIVRGRG